MIIVRKLNTKTFTGRDLVERLYSESWELEQREYGLVKKILRKTVRPILNSMISNKQKSMDKLNKSIKEDYVSDKRPEIMQSLGRKAKELNESLKTYKLSRSKKVLEALNRGLDDLTPSEKERLKINRENKIENLKRSIKSVFKKK